MPPRKKPAESAGVASIEYTEGQSEDTRGFAGSLAPGAVDADSVTMTKAALAELLAEGEAAARQEGYAAGLAEAKKLPLFEACKHAADRYWVSENDGQLTARFGDIEAEYGEKLADADIELILGSARRNRIADRATEMALEDLTRPRRQPRAVVVDREITV